MMRKNIKIKVKNSGFVKLQVFKDPPDGDLFIAEYSRHIPFKVKRAYFINHLDNKNAVRGKHAHKKLEQLVFCINGSFSLHLDDGDKKQKVALEDPSIGVRLGPLLWHVMTDFSKNCVILVLADDLYRESDYIRNYRTFLKLSNKL